MVPSYRRRSSFAVYDNANYSPERYRYRSPIKEAPHQTYHRDDPIAANVHAHHRVKHHPNPANAHHSPASGVGQHAYSANHAYPIQHQGQQPHHAQHAQQPLHAQHVQQPHHAQHVQQPHHAQHVHQPHHAQQLQQPHHAQQVQQPHQVQQSYPAHPPPHPRHQQPQNVQQGEHAQHHYTHAPNESSFYRYLKNTPADEGSVHVTNRTGRAEQPLATGPKPATRDVYAAPHCPYDQPIQMELKCANNYNWKTGEYVKDECGSGIVTAPCETMETRENWCKTPLSIYQSSICELGRKLLCGEIKIPRKMMGPPPCSLCEVIMPPCYGYYRTYEKLPPCEEQYVKISKGKKVYRDKIKRYWEPCDLPQAGPDEDIRQYSGHNAYLAMKLNTQYENDTLNF